MILWHTGATTAILWFVFRGNTRIDYRLVMLGAILPDLIDKPIGRIILRERFDSGRLWSHTLLVNVAFFSVLFFMRGRGKRKMVLVPIGSLLHLALDAVWSSPALFWWPLFGTDFPRQPLDEGVLTYLDPGLLVQEAVGLGLLTWLLSAHGMLNRPGIRAFIRTGRLEMAQSSNA